MNFSRNTVLSTLLVCALAVAFGGVAQAQDCIAQVGTPAMVRAEGITEVVGAVQLRCNAPQQGTEGIGFAPSAVAEMLTIAVQLNTNITNTIDDDRHVAVLADTDAATALNYLSGSIHLGANEYSAPRTAGTAINASVFGDGELSEDGTMITWELDTNGPDDNTDPFNLGVDDDGFGLTITGIRANASAVGAGEDVMVNVMVGDSPVNTTPIKAADVAYGIEIVEDELMDVDGVVCNDGEMTASFIIKEGFASGIMAMADSDTTTDVDESMRSDSIMVAVTGVPEGVKVTVPAMNMDTMTPTVENAYVDVLRLMRRTGRTSGADEDGVVELSHAGAGSVIYDVVARAVDTNDPITPDVATDDTGMSPDNSRADEWATLTVTFEWDGGAVDLGSVMLWVSFNPVSSDTGDSFANGGPKLPRFMEDGMGDTILTIGDCKSTLFYPFVTSNSGYDTGIVISNTSDVAGTCMATYSGMGAPEDPVDVGEVMPGMQSIFLVSSHMEDFTGYLTVDCTSQSASGFAHVVDSTGLAGSQGYIAE